MKLIMFAGAGAVGKTKLMEACIELAETRRMRVAQHKSTTRQTYERHGYSQESDALSDPETNRLFQHEVMADNIRELSETMVTAIARHKEVVFADRTPHDYAAYYFSVFTDKLDLHMIQRKRDLADSALAHMATGFDKPVEVVIYMLPYPCYWSEDTDSSDGWRSDTTGKNFVWSSIVEAEVLNIKRRLEIEGLYQHHITVKRLSPFLENGTPEERAIGILAEEFPLKGRNYFDDHPPSRHCNCKRCNEAFAIKDQAPADGLIYQTKG